MNDTWAEDGYRGAMTAKYKALGGATVFRQKTGRRSWWVWIQRKEGKVKWEKASEAGALSGLDVPESDFGGRPDSPKPSLFCFLVWWNSDLRTDPRTFDAKRWMTQSV